MFGLENVSFLIVDDNPADQFLCLESLVDQGAKEDKIKTVGSIEKMLEAVSSSKFDIILLDLFLPDSFGTDTFNQVKDKVSDSTVIVMSGYTDKKIALEAVKNGAQDFLIKGEFDSALLAKSILYSIERKKSIQLLQKSEQKYKILFETSPLPLLLINPETLEIEMTNEAGCMFFNTSKDKLINNTLNKYFVNYSKEEMIKKLTEGNIKAEQFKYIKSGETRYIRYYSNLFYEDNILKALVLYEDITEIINFKKDRLKIISSIQDIERKKFAKELHDDLGQQLVLANLYLNQLEKKSELKSEIQEIKEVVSQALEQSRNLTYNIMPPLLEEGIINGLESLFNRLSRLDSIKVNFNLDKDDDISKVINGELAYNIYRITQEFVNNTLKHAKASLITCDIKKDENKIIFKLKDNGVGFDMKKNYNGSGLRNFSERAEAFNLKVNLSSKLKEGTQLTLIVPNRVAR